MKKFFITTPIYYSNDIPHIGHAYSSFLADVYARFHKMIGYDVKFSTGVDENSQKTVQKAAEQNIDIHEYLDTFAAKHQAVWDTLRVGYTDFIRTSSEKHKNFVQQVLQKVYDKGDIYEGDYEGLYCVGCEAFKKETDLVKSEGTYEWIAAGTLVCPDHPNKLLEQIKEKNRFFRLSKYESELKEFYKNNPHFVQPSHRFNEVISFTNGGLEDFSISRETNKFGIPLPFDPEHVTYVRFDALLNYITVCQWGDEEFWSAGAEKCHVMAKDIVRFHAIYRPAMLMSAGYELPTKEIVTGFLTVDGQKMSKSIGNVVNPVEVVEKYGRDALVYYLLNEVSINSDGDFSFERFKLQFEANLIGGWGNLVSRVTNIAAKNGVTQGKKHDDLLESLRSNISDEGEFLRDVVLGKTPFEEIKNFYFSPVIINQFCRNWYEIVQECNQIMQSREPRKLFKDEATKEEATRIIETLLWLIKQLTIVMAPLLLDGTQKVIDIFGSAEMKSAAENNTLPEFFAKESFDLNLSPDIVYSRVE